MTATTPDSHLVGSTYGARSQGVRRSAHSLVDPGEIGLLAIAEPGDGINPHSVEGSGWETTRCSARQEPFAPAVALGTGGSVGKQQAISWGYTHAQGCGLSLLNNLQLKAGGLVLRPESSDTGHRPVIMTPCESCRAGLARSDAPHILAPSLRSSDQQWHSNSLVPSSGAPRSAFSAWGMPRTAYSRGAP
jgi:hypothetical protein